MERWTHEAALQEELAGNSKSESSFDFVPLEDVAKVTYGIQKCPANRPGKHARPYLRVANVQRNYLDLSKIKMINVPDAEMHKLALREGDLLLCEGNSPDLVGRGAIWREEIPDCVHQNHVLRVRILNRKRVMPEFILEYINSPQGQAYFRSKAKWTTNLASINSKEVAAMPLPLPDTLKRQEEILSAVKRVRDKAAAKRTEATRLRSQAWADFLGAIFN
jgi:type I restriction enzyme S subunit